MLNKAHLAISMFVMGCLAASLIYGVNERYAYSEASDSQISPSDHISEAELHVFKEKAVIDKEDLVWARIKDTHSMEPVLNVNSISLELTPQVPSDIQEGDIVSFEQDSIVIIHRVILIDNDEQGWFAVTKGDNNED